MGWVYASREGIRSHGPLAGEEARGGLEAGGGCERATRAGSQVETSVGRDGQTGPKRPRNNRICGKCGGS